MKYKLAFIRSKVARRVILLFFLSSLLPVAAIAFFSFTYISDLLTNQAYRQLQHSSKLYGMAVMDRLGIVDNELHELSKYLESRSFTQANSQTIHAVEQRMHALSQSNPGQINNISLEFVPESSLGPVQFTPAGRRKSYVFYRRNAKGVTHIYLRQILGKGHGNTMASLVARLNNEYVWGDKNRLPFSTSLCVIADSGQKLFCPNSRYQPVLEALHGTAGQVDPRRLRWLDAEGENLGVAWDLFVNSKFISSQGWKIISSRKKADALLPVIAYQKIFPLVIVFALLVVLLLSAIQVRRIMLPLERLVSATRRLARYEFDEPVSVSGRDEFSELSESFNTMAFRLEKQLNVLKILSDIDHLILTCPDPEVVLARILETADRIISCKFIGVYLLDKPDARNATLHIKTVENQPTRLQNVEIPEYEVAELINRGGLFQIDLQEHDSVMFAPLARKGVLRARSRTVVLDKHVRAVFCLCYRAGEEDDTEDAGIVSDLIDRLAVTLATADRDEKLYRQAHFDYLTGLPNRQLFNDRLEQHLIQARRKKEKTSILYIDLDRFKNINDSLGHSSGDNLLRMVSERMKECVRETDTVSRLGGDEFVILLANISSPKDAGAVAENIISTASRPFFVSAREIFINTSIGIAVYPDDGETGKELMAHADAAMYQAKESGRGTYKYFEESMNQELVQRIEMETAMRYALERGEFELYYQPQINLQSGRVSAVEALIRWQHPTLGKITPARFISLAEDSGLIEPIGEWVIRAACEQYMKWHERQIAPSRLAVNISSRQFMRDNFIDILRTTIRDTGILPTELELEITESLLLNENLNTRKIFDRLKELGVHIAIDDFGTGYSSLSYLKRFAVQTLKIDRSFTKDVPGDAQATTLTLSIIAMAQALNMQVVAEGVENLAQLNLMREHGCDFVQGYYFAKPLSLEDITRYLEQDSAFPNASSKR